MKTRDKILDSNTLKEAMISKNTLKVKILRWLKSEIQRIEGGNTIMTENQVVNLIKSNIETTKGSMKDADGKKIMNEEIRNDGWEEEVELYESFIPKQMSKDEIQSIIDGLVEDGLDSIKTIMIRFSKDYAGKADGSLVSTLVKEKLGISK